MISGSFPGGSEGKKSACNAGDLSLIPVFLPGEFHGQKSLVSPSPWSHKESDMTEQLTFHFFHHELRQGLWTEESV